MKRWIYGSLAAVILCALTAAPAGAAKKDKELEARLQALEERIAALEQTIQGLETRIEQRLDEAIAELAQREERAQEEFRAIQRLVAQGKHLEAKERMDAFLKKYAGTTAARSAASLNAELSVVGKPAPESFQAVKWFVGEGSSLDLRNGTTLLVFFEEWCPHCRREVPKLQQTYERFRERGLRVLGLTRVTRSATDEKVAQFCQQHNLSFPVAKESGEMSRYFAVRGIPAAAVVKDGKIVWRGHPAQLNDRLLESWLGAASTASGS